MENTGETVFNHFVEQAKTHRILWLLQAAEGQFALLGDDSNVSFIPVWTSESNAGNAVHDEWEGYTAVDMGLGEFIGWMDELDEDGILVGLNPDEHNKVVAISAGVLKKSLLS
jgi:hypothetical protein